MHVTAFVLVVVVLTLRATAVQVNITEEDQLETFLCSTSVPPLDDDTTLVLSNNITHLINGSSSFCLINSTYSLTITSDDPSQPARVNCNSSTNSGPSTGFGFITLHSLTLHKLVLTDCGSSLTGLGEVMEYVNSTRSPVYFTNTQSSVLFFLNITKLILQDINIPSYYGFALVTINPINAQMNNINCSKGHIPIYSPRLSESLGSGFLFLFTDSVPIVETLGPLNVSINGAVFIGNYDRMTNKKYFPNIQLPRKKSHIQLDNAVALTIIYTQKNFSANVHVNGTQFIDNCATTGLGGVMLILHYNNLGISNTVITRSHFSQNFCFNLHNKYKDILSAAIMILSYLKEDHSCSYHHQHVVSRPTHNRVQIIDGSFSHHGEVFKHLRCDIRVIRIAAFDSSQIDILFKEVKFIINYPTIGASTGSCIYATASTKTTAVDIVMEDTLAYSNNRHFKYPSISNDIVFHLSRINSLIINGTSRFIENFGSVFEVIDTLITMEGTLYFEGNEAEEGAVFKLNENSQLHLQKGLRASFINNTVQTKGGAIIDNDNGASGQCTFQTDGPFDSPGNISLIFANNTARQTGDSIFSNNLYNCLLNGQNISPKQAEVFLCKISNNTLNNTLSSVSTSSKYRCLCFNRSCVSQSTNFSLQLSVYPGLSVDLPLAAIDGFNRITFSQVSLQLAYKKEKNDFFAKYTFKHVENNT